MKAKLLHISQVRLEIKVKLDKSQRARICIFVYLSVCFRVFFCVHKGMCVKSVYVSVVRLYLLSAEVFMCACVMHV